MSVHILSLLYTIGFCIFSPSFIHAKESHEANVSTARPKCSDEESIRYPHHCHLMDVIASDPETLSHELYQFSKAVGFVIDEDRFLENNTPNISSKRKLASVSLPSVLAHGMGDSCFNTGMMSVTTRVSKLMGGSYSICIGTGNSQKEDTINGYFLNMDASIDAFALKVKSDPQLKHGFNAVGFSQGNNVIRGYIARYNDPPVNTFVSINGVNAGVSAVPYCLPPPLQKNQHDLTTSKICDALMEIASHRAYSEFAQRHSFQANYWRDVREEEIENYREYSQLAQLNNEGHTHNSTLNDNFSKTKRFVWIMATEDRVVYPPEGEQWAAPNPADPFHDILPMNKTEWYLKDLFGLKTASEKGKNFFESFVGNHLQFKMQDFDVWIQKYFSM